VVAELKAMKNVKLWEKKEVGNGTQTKQQRKPKGRGKENGFVIGRLIKTNTV